MNDIFWWRTVVNMYCLFCWIWPLHSGSWISWLQHGVGISGTFVDKNHLSLTGAFELSWAPSHPLCPLCHGVYRMGRKSFHCISCCLSEISCHVYGDYCQLDLPFNHSDSFSIRLLFDCLSDVKSWMAQMFWGFFIFFFFILMNVKQIQFYSVPMVPLVPHMLTLPHCDPSPEELRY